MTFFVAAAVVIVVVVVVVIVVVVFVVIVVVDLEVRPVVLSSVKMGPKLEIIHVSVYPGRITESKWSL